MNRFFQVAMFIFTLSLSLWVSSIAIYHDASWVLMAIGITALLCLGLTLFSFQTKWDFTGKTNNNFSA
jgi:FtsH-binding integral membrane protein